MAEELRFFLRTALYSAVLAVIYWFASFDQRTGAYDWAGTALLVFVVLAAGAIVAVGGAAVRGSRSEIVPPRGSPLGRGAGTVNRVIGFTEHGGEDERRRLASGPEAYPRRSGWPLLAGFSILMVGTGLVFGEWLLVPGLAVGALAGWGWLTQLDRPR